MFSWGHLQIRGFGERGQALVYGKRKWPVARRGWAAARVGGALRCLFGPAVKCDRRWEEEFQGSGGTRKLWGRGAKQLAMPNC